jgi:spermidine synthase
MIKLGRITLLEKVILLGFYLSGFAALTYEQIWTHLLFLVFGTSTYAFSVMLTAFFIGLALGSHIMGRFVDRLSFPILWFSLIELAIGICGLAVLPAFSTLDLTYLLLFQKTNSAHLFILMWIFLPFWLLIPTTLMGATLPLVSKIFASEREKIGAHVGMLYSANTFGGIVGSFSAGFLLIPYLGLVWTCILAALSNIIVAFIIFFYSEGLLQVQDIYKSKKAGYFKNIKRVFYLLLAVSLVLTFYISNYKIDPTFAGAYYTGMRMGSIDEWRESKENFDILYNKFGRYGLVVVGKDKYDNLYLSVNGKTEASTAKSDAATQYLTAYIPMIVHENPKKVLNIGLGGGFTLSAIENFNETERIDCIEIDPAIERAAREYFSDYTNNALDDPRLNHVIADGRNYLQNTPEKYDVIVSEPSNPWISGEGSLFTREFFQIVQGHLNEGGIFCQWAPMYEHDREDFKIFLKTFHSVFPHVQVYNSGTDIIILGSGEPMEISYPRLAKKLKDPKIKSDFNEMSQVPRFTTYPDVDWFLSTYKMDSGDVAEYVEGGIQMNTDDHTVLEFRTAINAMRKRYAEDQQSTVDPLSDMINFMEMHHGSPFFVPPLTGMVEQKESKDIIGLLDIEVERGSSWILDTASCKYVHGVVSSEVLAYSSNCYAKYTLPDQGVLISTFVDAYSPPEKGEFERLIRDNFGFDSVNYRGDAVVNEHDAYIFDVSLGGGTAGGLSLAWHCSDKNRAYMTAAVYPSKTFDKGKALEAVSKVRCYPS